MPTLGPRSFKGGWNPRSNVYSIGDDQISDSQNINITYDTISKRNGSVLMNASTFASGAAVHGLTDWLINSGTRYQVLTAGTKIGQMSALSGTISDITGAVTITSGSTNLHTFASLNNILVICGGATPDAPIQWTGTGNAAALTGSPPSGNLCCVANNFLFISGIAATPSRIQWSNVADPQTWTASNYVDFRASDGDVITALCEMNQNLIVFKKRSIGQFWTVTQTVSGAVTIGPMTQIVPGLGCVGSQAVDKLPDGRLVFFATNGHVYIFDGTSLKDISDRPPPQPSVQSALDGISETRFPYISVRVYASRSQVWISASTGSSSTANNMVYVYNYQKDIWESAFTGIAANVMCSCIDTRANPQHPQVMVTGNYGGSLYEQDRGSSNAEDANGIIDGYATQAILLGKEDREFIPRSALVNLQTQGNFNVELNYGFNGFTETTNTTLVPQFGSTATLDSLILNTSTLGSNAAVLKKVLFLTNGQSQSMQVQFRNRNSGQPFVINSYIISDEVLI